MYGIYHHRDLDGLCSAAIMKLRYPNIKLIGYDYGEPIPQLDRGREIIIADVSFPMDIMHDIALDTMGENEFEPKFTWIDHHLSAYKEFNETYKDTSCPINYIYDQSISACEGVWKHLFPNTQMPDSVYLLGKYDTWRQENSVTPSDNPVDWNTTLTFQAGMKLDSHYNIPFIINILKQEYGDGGDNSNYILKNIFDAGKYVLEYQAGINKEQCRMFSFEAEFEGLRAICLNGGGFNSQTFESVWDENKYDVMIPFIYTGKFWKFSLYTTKNIDLSVIAKKHGGGGHAKACGFQKEDITEVFPQIEIDKRIDIGQVIADCVNDKKY